MLLEAIVLLCSFSRTIVFDFFPRSMAYLVSSFLAMRAVSGMGFCLMQYVLNPDIGIGYSHNTCATSPSAYYKDRSSLKIEGFLARLLVPFLFLVVCRVPPSTLDTVQLD